jgi:hypothetical protein
LKVGKHTAHYNSENYQQFNQVCATTPSSHLIVEGAGQENENSADAGKEDTDTAATWRLKGTKTKEFLKEGTQNEADI